MLYKTIIGDLKLMSKLRKFCRFYKTSISLRAFSTNFETLY